MLCRWVCFCSLYVRSSIHPAIRHRGTLIQKIHRQASSWAKMPPSAGPTTEEMAQTLATYPCTFARSATV